MKTVSFQLAESHYDRLEQAAEARGMTVENYVYLLAIWNSTEPK